MSELPPITILGIEVDDFPGNIAIVFYSRALTADEQADIEGHSTAIFFDTIAEDRTDSFLTWDNASTGLFTCTNSIPMPHGTTWSYPDPAWMNTPAPQSGVVTHI